MVLSFTVTILNICNKWLLSTSHLPCTQGQNTRGNEWEKAAMHIWFWKICKTAVHVDTEKMISANVKRHVKQEEIKELVAAS